MSKRVVKRPDGQIDIERSSLDVVILAEAGGQRRCPECKCPTFLAPHRWNCPRHERFNATPNPDGGADQ